jgi:hypothetical protein
MYYIKLDTDKPDVVKMEQQVKAMMQRGIKVGNCQKLLTYYTELMNASKLELQEKYGIENTNSSKQIIAHLQEISRKADPNSENDIIKVCYDDTANKWTSNDEALSKLALLGYEFAQSVKDYRTAKKYSDSINSLLKFKDSNDLVHPVVSRAVTNRIYYSDPAIMSIPKVLLYHLITPLNDTDVLYSVDIKNQEPGILANMTHADDLKEALQSEDGLYESLFKKCFEPKATANILVDTLSESRTYEISELKNIKTVSPVMYMPKRTITRGVKYNNETVSGIETICIGTSQGERPKLPSQVKIETAQGNIYSLPVTWEDYGKKYTKSADYEVKGVINGLEVTVLPEERKEFKTAWLAISYGQSSFGLSKACKYIDANHVYNYITKSNGLKEYRAKINKQARSLNNNINTIFKTPLQAEYTSDAKALNRKLLNMPIQGTGADILSLLINHFNETVEKQGLQDCLFIYFTRHDELIIEVNEELYNQKSTIEVSQFLKDLLEHQIEDWIPFKVDVEKIIIDYSLENMIIDSSKYEDDDTE